MGHSWHRRWTINMNHRRDGLQIAQDPPRDQRSTLSVEAKGIRLLGLGVLKKTWKTLKNPWRRDGFINICRVFRLGLGLNFVSFCIHYHRMQAKLSRREPPRKMTQMQNGEIEREKVSGFGGWGTHLIIKNLCWHATCWTSLTLAFNRATDLWDYLVGALVGGPLDAHI